VRELENVIRRALVVVKGDAILPADLPPELMTPRAADVAAPGSHGLATADVPALARALFQHARRDAKLKLIPAIEREMVIQALLETRGNQLQAAKLLGITRATLRKRVEKFGIKQGLAIE
jgi:two-component system nitrogen regulation response regulator GlnG